MPQLKHHQLSKCFLLMIGMVSASAGLAGCSADVSYGSYRFGPGYEAGQVHESRVYGNAEQGLGAENCRTIIRREADVFGRPASQEETVCQ